MQYKTKGIDEIFNNSFQNKNYFSTSYWYKAHNYQIMRWSDNDLYICPYIPDEYTKVLNTNTDFLYKFEIAQEYYINNWLAYKPDLGIIILKDFLSIKSELIKLNNGDDLNLFRFDLFNEELKSKAAELVLSFVNNYGLIGLLIRAKDTILNKITYDRATGIHDFKENIATPFQYFLDENHFIIHTLFIKAAVKTSEDEYAFRGQSCSILNFIKTFFPGVQSDILTNNFFPDLLYYCMRSGLFTMNYCEPVSLILAIVEILHTIYNELNSNCDPDKCLFEIKNATFQLYFDKDCNQVKYKFDFTSLYDILRYNLILALTTREDNLVVCSHCGKAEIKKSRTAKYCSESCYNAAKQRRHRQKVKANK